MLALCLGCVNADDSDTLSCEPFVPALVPRVIMDAVDSAERPKVQDDDLAT
jgi:hypothetical protein